MRTMRDTWATFTRERVDDMAEECLRVAQTIHAPADLDRLVDRIGDARCVLLGEATHGTSEYYTWRARLSQRLIQEKGFSFIAVEGDWPDCYRVNRYVKGYPDSGDSAREVLHAFSRWPTWMWANWEVAALAERLRKRNDSLPPKQRTGFYGLDVYSLWESLDEILKYLGTVDGEAVEAAKKAFRCFEPFGEEGQEYARATISLLPAFCEEEAVALLGALRQAVPTFDGDREAQFVADQNGLVVKNAERYYRTMVGGSSASWNVRDQHMAETLERLMRFHGPDAKAIVWEHNTHVGDARATDMAQVGMVNIGQLARDAHSPDEVVLVGFGSHSGTVIAGYEWGAPMRKMQMPSARAGSWEDVLHRSMEGSNSLLLSEDLESTLFHEPIGHRAIGVVYDPDYEHWGNYVPTVIPRRYDAFIYLDTTEALHPMHLTPTSAHEPPEAYPWGV